MSIQPLQPADLLRIPLDGPRPSFSRALWRIASADVSSGNRVTLLRDGPGTFEAMLAMIRTSEESRSAMGAAGRARVERDYGEEQVVAAYLRALDEATDESNRISRR